MPRYVVGDERHLLGLVSRGENSGYMPFVPHCQIMWGLKKNVDCDTITDGQNKRGDIKMSAEHDTYLINIRRVRNFVALYETATQNLGPGRRDTLTTDILRAGVVFLHSTLEDYLRSVILRKKQEMMAESQEKFNQVLSNVALIGDNSGRSTGKKYGLSELWMFKEQSIMDIAVEALRDKISYITFNEYSQIVGSLKEIDIIPSRNFNNDGIIDNYISRRHKIVHEADNNSSHGRGNHRSASIGAKNLNAWIDAVNALVEDIEGQL